MKAHIVGGGFGGLAAAALLIRNANVPGQDITIYEADDDLGGGYFFDGSPARLQSARLHLRQGIPLRVRTALVTIPTLGDPKHFRQRTSSSLSMTPTRTTIRRTSSIATSPSCMGRITGWALRTPRPASLSADARSLLDGRRIEEFFSPDFFKTEFWLLWSTIMGSLPQHSVIEFRRYMNRFLYLFPHLSTMARVIRSPFNQHEAFVKPLVAWLTTQRRELRDRRLGQRHRLRARAQPHDRQPARLSVKNGAATSVAVAPEDIVLVTTGSQAADHVAGTMDNAPRPAAASGQSWALWKSLAQRRKGFGDPDEYFGAPQIADSRWVTFTVTTTGSEFVERITKLLGGVEPGCGGLQTLRDSNWVISFSIFHQPEVLGQPQGTYRLVGLWAPSRTPGQFCQETMVQCTGEEILEEVLRNLRFDDQLDAIMKSSICIPCDLPYVNNIWLPRSRGDRPPVVPEGSTNLGLIGQYVELEQDIAFTFEYSTRSAWEAIHRLLKLGPAAAARLSGAVRSKGDPGRPGGVPRAMIRRAADQAQWRSRTLRGARMIRASAYVAHRDVRRLRAPPLRRHETLAAKPGEAGAPMWGALTPPRAMESPTPAKSAA